MSHFYQKNIFLLLIFILLFSCATVPVYADRAIDSVTLNGSSSVTVAPSASITVAMTVTTNALNDKNWRATSWNISGSNCINHTDHNGAGTYNESFTVTAPSSPGTYNISFIAYADSACTTDASSTYTLTGGITVSSPATPTPSPGPTATPGPGATPTPTPTSSPSSSSSTTSTTYYPSVTIDTYAQNPTNRTVLTLSGNATIEQGSIATIEYTTDNTNWVTTTSDGSFNSKDEHFTFTTPRLSEGIYTIKVRAKSAAGITTSDDSYASQTITIATTPPDITLSTITPNPTKNQTPKLSGTTSAKLAPISKVEVSIDSGVSWQAAKRTGNSYNVTLEKLEDGNYQIRSRAIDSAGNIGYSTIETLIIDTIPPIIGGGMQSLGPQILTPDNEGKITIVAQTETTIAISMKGGVTSAEVTSDSESFPLKHMNGTAIWTGKILFAKGGEKQLFVSAIDGAGNTTKRQFNTLTIESSGVITDKKTNQPIDTAVISLFYYEAISQQWILWEAQSYGQQNPQVTDATGFYSFMVPPGTYYLHVHTPGFTDVQSEIITLSENSILNYTFPLNSKPKLEFTLPLLGKVLLTIPSFFPPETLSLPQRTTEEKQKNPARTQIGTRAPQFKLPDLENKQVALSDFTGKPVLLTFIAPWSPLSLEQVAFLSDVSQGLTSSERMIVISLQESVATTQTLMKNGNYTFPIVADLNGETAKDYAITLLPQHFFIDSKGTITHALTGVFTSEELLTQLSKVP